MTAYQAGTAYVEILPSIRGMNRSIRSQLNGAIGTAGQAAGARVGANMATGVGTSMGLVQRSVSRVLRPVSRMSPAMTRLSEGFHDARVAASAFSGRAGQIGGVLRRAATRVDTFTRGVRTMGSRVWAATANARAGINRMSDAWVATVRRIGTRALAAGLVTVGGSAIYAGQMFEQTRKSLKGLYGSGEQANDMMARLRKLAGRSPIDYGSFAKAAQNLAYMGYKGKDAAQVLRNVSDAVTAAGGGADQMERVSSAMLSMINQGRVTADILNRISDAGVPIFDGLSAHFHKSVSQVRDMVTAGKVGIDDVMETIQQAQGKTFKQMKRASAETAKTLQNRFLIAKNNIVMALGELAENTVSKIGPAITWLGDKLTNVIKGIPGWLHSVRQGMESSGVMQALRNIGGALSNLWNLAKPFFSAFATGFKNTLGAVVITLGKLLPPLVDFGRWIDKHTGIVKILGTAIGGLAAVMVSLRIATYAAAAAQTAWKLAMGGFSVKGAIRGVRDFIGALRGTQAAMATTEAVAETTSAGVQRSIGTKLGSALRTTGRGAKQFGGMAVRGMQALSGFGGVAGTVAGGLIGGAGLAVAVGTVRGAIQHFRDQAKRSATDMSTMRAAFAKSGGSATQLTSNLDKVMSKTDESTDSFKFFGLRLSGSAESVDQRLQKVGVSSDLFKRAIQGQGNATAVVRGKLDKLANSYDVTNPKLAESSYQAGQLRSRLGELQATYNKQWLATTHVNSALKQYKQSVLESGMNSMAAKSDLASYKDGLRDAGYTNADVKRKVDALNRSLNGQINGLDRYSADNNATRALHALTDANAEATRAVQKHGRKSKEARDAQDNLTSTVETAIGAWRDQAKAAGKGGNANAYVRRKMIDLYKTSKGVLRPELARAARKMGFDLPKAAKRGGDAAARSLDPLTKQLDNLIRKGNEFAKVFSPTELDKRAKQAQKYSKKAGLSGVFGTVTGIGKAAGGSVQGPGTGTSDSILARLSNGEHVWTAREVAGAGGHGAVEALRRMAGGYAKGGPVGLAAGGAADRRKQPAASQATPGVAAPSADELNQSTAAAQALTAALQLLTTASTTYAATVTAPLIPALASIEQHAGVLAPVAVTRLTGTLPVLGGQTQTLAATTNASWAGMTAHIGANANAMTARQSRLQAFVANSWAAMTARMNAAANSMSGRQATLAGFLSGSWQTIATRIVGAQNRVMARQQDTQSFLTSSWNYIASIVHGSVGRQQAAFGSLNNGLAGVRQAIQHTADWAKSQYGRMQEAAAAPVRWVLQHPFNAGIIAAWNKLNKEFSFKKHVKNVPVGFRSGGPVHGAGTATSDSVPAMLSNGEFVVNAKSARITRPFLQALNRREPEAIQAAGARMAEGGSITNDRKSDAIARAQQFAKSMAGKPYVWGGANPRVGTDCSGMVGMALNVARGNAPRRIGATGNMPWPGMAKGLKSAFGIGVVHRKPIGHTAATVGGKNVESAKTPIVYPGKHGADDSQFNLRYHVPFVGGKFVSGGGGGADIDPAALVADAFKPTAKMLKQGRSKWAGNTMGEQSLGIADQASKKTQQYAVKKLSTMLGGEGGAMGTGTQMANARMIAQVARSMGLGRKALVIALATALQESGLRNLNYGDRDSLGLFQQRPSMGWGSPAQVRNPRYAARKFFNALKGVSGWQSMPVTVAAQRVQRSAFPGAYAKHTAKATNIAKALGFDSGGTLPPGLSLAYNGTGSPEPVFTERQLQALTQNQGGSTEVRVFIGEEEITSRIDTRIEAEQARTAAALRAGRR